MHRPCCSYISFICLLIHAYIKRKNLLLLANKITHSTSFTDIAAYSFYHHRHTNRDIIQTLDPIYEQLDQRAMLLFRETPT